MVDTTGPPPVLSTPATHLLEPENVLTGIRPHPSQSLEQICIRYEIDRTIAEIKQAKWSRIALQFPDSMLPDAPTVFEQLSQRLEPPSGKIPTEAHNDDQPPRAPMTQGSNPPRLFILADTSYGACCVDEIAAEHVNADVVIHYGRACLSPTVRLPVVHVFTKPPLAIDSVIKTFKSTYEDHNQAIILMSDVTIASHLNHIGTILQADGYSSIFVTDVIHDPASPLPNRTVPQSVNANPERLQLWQLFHISSPPDSLLLTLSSRVSSIHIYPTDTANTIQGTAVLATSVAVALRRRYALLTSASRTPIFGILINTLSVKNYLDVLEKVRCSISGAGKKSYTFVVGKINAAKLANFSEIGAWVVIGCWESSLIDSKDFWKPILTPFELKLALTCDEQRIWTGEWKSDFQSVLEDAQKDVTTTTDVKSDAPETDFRDLDGDGDSEPESAPPEFDLRAGRYISQSRPMRTQSTVKDFNNYVSGSQKGHTALLRRAKGDLVTIGGNVSPGADFLQANRTWKGLGSDLEMEYDPSKYGAIAALEEGRSGIARGYVNSQSTARS